MHLGRGRTAVGALSESVEAASVIQRDAHAGAVKPFWGQVIRYLPGSIVPLVLGLVSSSVFARYFGAEQYGQYSFVIGIVALVGGLAGRWLQQAIIRYVSGETNPEALAAIKRAVLLSFLVIASTVVFAAIPVSHYIKVALPSWYEYYWPAVAAVLVTVVLGALNTILQAGLEAGRHTIYNLVRGLLFLLLSLAFVLWIYRHPAAIILANVVSWAILVPFIWRDTGMPLRLGNRSELQEGWETFRYMMRYGLPLVGWYLGNTVLNIGDRYVIQVLQGSEQVGIYAANYGLTNGAISLLTTPIVLATQPMLVGAMRSRQQTEAARWLSNISGSFFSVGALAVGLLFVFSRDVSGILLGPEFSEGHLIVPLALAGTVLWQLSTYFQVPIEFEKKTTFLFAVSAGAATFNLGLNLLFVPHFGYIAAAYATIVSYLVYAVVVYFAGQRYLKWTLDWKRVGTRAATTIMMTMMLFILRWFAEKQMGYLLALLLTLITAGLSSLAFVWDAIPPDLRTKVVQMVVRLR